jgi:predicted metal-dependent hydrolase
MTPQPRDILFEIQRVGTQAKVTAIDSLTQIEVSIVMPASASETEMKQFAKQRLNYVLKKQNLPEV